MKKIPLVIGIFCFGFFFSQKSQNYLQISYASICCGPPSATPVANYVAQFQKKNKTKPLEIFQQSGLGREGEFNLYISTDQLSKTQKKSFINGLKSAISAQNEKRNEGNQGIVNFDSSIAVKKADLVQIKNLNTFKNKLIK